MTMAKAVVIYHTNNDQEIKSALVSNSVSYRQAMQHRENTAIDMKSCEVDLKTIKCIIEIAEQDVVIVLMRNFIEPDSIRIGDHKLMVKRSIESLIDILEEIP